MRGRSGPASTAAGTAAGDAGDEAAAAALDCGATAAGLRCDWASLGPIGGLLLRWGESDAVGVVLGAPPVGVGEGGSVCL